MLEDDARIRGYIQFGDVTIRAAPANPGDHEIRRLYVDPERQGEGFGRRLMEAAFANQRLVGACDIYLQVWDQNHRAVGLYRSLGFDATGKIDAVVGDRIVGQDCVVVLRHRGLKSATGQAASRADPTL